MTILTVCIDTIKFDTTYKLNCLATSPGFFVVCSTEKQVRANLGSFLYATEKWSENLRTSLQTALSAHVQSTSASYNILPNILLLNMYHKHPGVLPAFGSAAATARIPNRNMASFMVHLISSGCVAFLWI